MLLASVNYRHKSHWRNIRKCLYWSQHFGCALKGSKEHHCQVIKAADRELVLPLFITDQLCHTTRGSGEAWGSYPIASKYDPKLLEMNLRWSVNHGGICSISSPAKNSYQRRTLLELTLKTQREAKADSTLSHPNLLHMPLHLIGLPSNSSSHANRVQGNNCTRVSLKANQ